MSTACEDQQSVVHFSTTGRLVCWAVTRETGRLPSTNCLEHLPEAQSVPWCQWCVSSCSTISNMWPRGRKKECVLYKFSQHVLRSHCLKWLAKLMESNWCGASLPASWQTFLELCLLTRSKKMSGVWSHLPFAWAEHFLVRSWSKRLEDQRTNGHLHGTV